jgi:hypothetical protein
MDEPRQAPLATPRRAFLRVLVFAPAVAACATGGGAKHGAAPVPAPEQPPARTSVPPGADALAPVREFPLAASAEPAFVFRAAAARPEL